MDISLISLIIFILFTIIYFWFVKGSYNKLTLAVLDDPQQLLNYNTTNIQLLGFYLLVIVVTQFFLNSSYLMSKCGGTIGKNIGAAAIFTFIPWVLIFGIMIAVLFMFPGFKSAFSDVLGYYMVSFQASDLLSSILLGTDINKVIDQTADPSKKSELTMAAEAIMKICGNKSILINQMNPDNFGQIWDTLKPLMLVGAYEDQEKKQQLLDLVVFKDNVGEAIWYIYTAILISSIVYYNLATRGCAQDVNQMKAQRDAYLAEQEKQEQQQELNNSTTYTQQ